MCHGYDPPPLRTMEGILLQPESSPLSSIESALQANLVRRSLSMSPDKDVMAVKSVGKVCKFCVSCSTPHFLLTCI